MGNCSGLGQAQDQAKMGAERIKPDLLDQPQSKTVSRSDHSSEAVPIYLSTLSPSTPVNIPKLTSYLHDHPDQAHVNNLLTGLSQGFKIGFQGPRVAKEYPNLISASEHPSIITKNILKEVQLGHTAGPFALPPFTNLRVYPMELSQRSTPKIGAPFSTEKWVEKDKKQPSFFNALRGVWIPDETHFRVFEIASQTYHLTRRKRGNNIAKLYAN